MNMTKENFQPNFHIEDKKIAHKLKTPLDQSGDSITHELIDKAAEGKLFADADERYIDKHIARKGKEFSEAMRTSAELREQDQIRSEIDRLFREHNPDDVAELDEGRQIRDERIVFRHLLEARGLRAKERKVVLDESQRVADFVEELGIPPINEERLTELVLTMKDGKTISNMLTPGKAGTLGNGENRFVVMNPKLLSQSNLGAVVLDHEMLHMYQSTKCPKSLTEGITTLYTEEMQKGTMRKLMAAAMTLLTPYGPGRLNAAIYRAIAGPEALADTYFKGDTTELFDKYREKLGSMKSLEWQLRTMEGSRTLLRKYGPIATQFIAILSYSRDIGTSIGAMSDYITFNVKNGNRHKE